MKAKTETQILAELILIFGTLDRDAVPKDSVRRYKKLEKWAKRNCCDYHAGKSSPKEKNKQGGAE